MRPFPTLDRKWKISQGGAVHPHWRRDGKELLFVDFTDKSVMAVDVAPGRDGLEFLRARNRLTAARWAS